MRLRLATADDLGRIDAIYNQAIAHGFCTADLRPLGAARRAAWFARHAPGTHPVYVCVEDGRVLGWASLSAYRPGREALQDVAELSYYVDFDHHRRGIGTRLVARMEQAARTRGKRVLFAIVIEGNAGSIALLNNAGFAPWGFLPEVVRHRGETRGQHYLGKLLR
jgi:phosphinothricin acetyltransferase